jgi:hypothetical protein
METIDAMVAELESRGLGWDVGNTGRMIEARIWKWPYVIARYRPHKLEPIKKMLDMAVAQINLANYPIIENENE